MAAASQADPNTAGKPARRPDPALFFAAPAHARLLDLVRHLAENTDHVALINGPLGAGKTTLLYRILGEAPRHWRLCRVDANPMMHPDQLLNCLTRYVELTPNDPTLMEQIPEAFAALRQQGLLPVVVLDDADQLPPSSLMTLLRLFEQRAEGVPPFALILLADPLIDTTLDAAQLHAMGTERFNRLNMPPLEPDQTGDYIHHFLRIEGVEGRIELSAEQLRRIEKEGGGLPGKVNDLVLKVLRETGERSAATPAPSWIQRLRDLQLPPWPQPLRNLPPSLLVPAVAVAAVLVLGLLFQDSINGLFRETPGVAEPQPGTFAGTQSGERTAASTGDPLVQPLALPPRTDAVSEAEPEPEPIDMPAEPDLPLSEPLIPPRQPQLEVTEEVDLQSAPAPPTEAPPASEPEPPQVQAPPPRMVKKPTPPPASRPATPVPASDRGRNGSDWLLSQKPDAYTLQLLGVSNEQAVLRFIRQHHLSGDIFYVETRRNGQPWFVLLRGIYGGRAAAVADLATLPPTLRESGAWPRSLASVQDAIRAKGH